MSADPQKLDKLREVITESLRVQRGGEKIEYVNVGNALQDACAKQNHTIFARRGCGKTLLLHHSGRQLNIKTKSIYLNCEDFKRHSFPNVLIEILQAIFEELDRNLTGWFGKKKTSREIIRDVLSKLKTLQQSADTQEEAIRQNLRTEKARAVEAAVESSRHMAAVSVVGVLEQARDEEIERSFRVRKDKLQELDRWLPELKGKIRTFFDLSNSVEAIILQIDDFYHLKRPDQAFVADYIHRLCKDLPIYFKIATLRHASTLFLDREGQPVGAQERHDYQPINIDYTFSDFKKTAHQNWLILEQFGRRADLSYEDVDGLFKGEGFNRLVMAGGGVPRDVLSLFLEILNDVDAKNGGRIGKDEVRLLSRTNFERRIEELKQDAQGNEQDELLRGIYIIRSFCLEKKTNLFVVKEQMLQQNDAWRALIYRLLDYRIIHNCAAALTHKSVDGTYQAFAIDIGCYAHLRKLHGRFNEVDVSLPDAKERMRSSPVLDSSKLEELFISAPSEVEAAIFAQEEEVA